MKYLKLLTLVSILLLLLFSYCDKKDEGLSDSEKIRADLVELQEVLKSEEYKKQEQMNQHTGDEAQRNLKARINKKREEGCVLIETFNEIYEGGTYKITVVKTDENWKPLADCSFMIPDKIEEDDRLGTVSVSQYYVVWKGTFTSKGEDEKETYVDKESMVFKMEINDSKSEEDLNMYINMVSEGKTTFNFKDRDVTIELLSKFDYLEESIDKIENFFFKSEFNFDVLVSGIKYYFTILEEDLDLTEEQESYAEDRVFIVSTVKLYKGEENIGYISVYNDLTMDILDMDKVKVE